MARRWIKRGCLGLLAIAMVLVFAAVAVVYVQAQRGPKNQPEYVALGSSFSAGAGLGELQDDSPVLCARSVNGYPQQLARNLGLSIVDMSCGGAVTKHLLHGGQFFQGPQIGAIGKNTKLVTITVGGNDVGYVGDLSMLAVRNTGSFFGRLVRLFWDGPKRMEERGFDKLAGELEQLTRPIRRSCPRPELARVFRSAFQKPMQCAPWVIGLRESPQMQPRRAGRSSPTCTSLEQRITLAPRHRGSMDGRTAGSRHFIRRSKAPTQPPARLRRR